MSELLSFSVKPQISQTCRPSQGNRLPDHAAEKWSKEIEMGMNLMERQCKDTEINIM